MRVTCTRCAHCFKTLLFALRPCCRSQAEEQKLRSLVEREGARSADWDAKAKLLGTDRSATSVHQHWLIMIRQGRGEGPPAGAPRDEDYGGEEVEPKKRRRRSEKSDGVADSGTGRRGRHKKCKLGSMCIDGRWSANPPPPPPPDSPQFRSNCSRTPQLWSTHARLLSLCVCAQHA